MSPSPAPKICLLSILWTFVTGRSRPRQEIQDDELVGGNGRVGQEVRARVDRGGVDSEVPEQGGRGDVDARSPVPALGAGLLRETDRDEGPVALEGDDRRIAGLDGLPERDHGRLIETGGDLADACGAPRELGRRLERERDELRVSRRAGVHPDLAVGQVGEVGGHPVVILLLLGCRGDCHCCGDAEGEGDRGECRPGPGLVAGEVTQRQARADRGVSGGSGEDADREWAQEQGAEDRRHDPGDDERHSVSVGQCETADTDRDQRRGRDRGVSRGPRLRRTP